MKTKKQQYLKLVEKRKACRLCVGLTNPADTALCSYDSNEIGPWSRLHGDLEAQVMVIGQDWGDVDYFVENRGKDELDNPTTCNLEKLLSHIGINIFTTTDGERNQGLFLTNAILCLKQGGLQAKVDRKWVANCSANFLRQQIEIVQPKVVVGLGEFAFHSVLRTFGLPTIKLKDAISDAEGRELLPCVRLFAAYHCGKGTINRNRDLKQQTVDWERIGRFLNPKSRR
jgi:uracil-DNA glycosylase family 4